MSALADLRGFAPNRRAAPDFAPNLERLKSTRDAAGPLGLTLVPAEARGLDALEQAFATMIGERAQALTVLSDDVLFNCLPTRALLTPNGPNSTRAAVPGCGISQ